MLNIFQFLILIQIMNYYFIQCFMDAQISFFYLIKELLYDRDKQNAKKMIFKELIICLFYI